MKRPRWSRHRQAGATAVEFALVLPLLLTFLLGIIDLSRMLYTWNAAHEAARAGARFAVVCDDTARSAQVLARMHAWLPQVRSAEVRWQPAGCDPGSCTGVSVHITDLDFQWISPIAGAQALAPWRMPEFAAYLPREVMRRDPHSEAFCTP